MNMTICSHLFDILLNCYDTTAISIKHETASGGHGLGRCRWRCSPACLCTCASTPCQSHRKTPTHSYLPIMKNVHAQFYTDRHWYFHVVWRCWLQCDNITSSSYRDSYFCWTVSQALFWIPTKAKNCHQNWLLMQFGVDIKVVSHVYVENVITFGNTHNS